MSDISTDDIFNDTFPDTSLQLNDLKPSPSPKKTLKPKPCNLKLKKTKPQKNVTSKQLSDCDDNSKSPSYSPLPDEQESHDYTTFDFELLADVYKLIDEILKKSILVDECYLRTLKMPTSPQRKPVSFTRGKDPEDLFNDSVDLDSVDWDNELLISNSPRKTYTDKLANSKTSTSTITSRISNNNNNNTYNTTINKSKATTSSSSNVNKRKDDTAEYRKEYSHTGVMNEVLHSTFGLKSYRTNQQEIINASLSHEDCFVLMPTGGGKSLCYQLPAVLTPGVTIVISPLRALISDQVDKLNALDIPSAHLCSDVKKDDTNLIVRKLYLREPLIKLLYLTPEKISASEKVVDALKSLYCRGKLARFVIDEVHCLSTWGHDFRPDYKQLSCLRRNYPNVPIICLTATATNVVQSDVIGILNLARVKTFIRSFNRPNIKYTVLPKDGKSNVTSIAKQIREQFVKQSGIVYCLGRNDCDKLASDLTKLGIKSKSYHAGMNDKLRESVQREWMNDQFHVIVATIAFGMGIDKPDVRFVIHNSVPKSVEAFYQESGRAGRDGELSFSYLYYSYSDVIRLKKIMQMDKSAGSRSTLDGHFGNLQQMAIYCENRTDCRRHLQLHHLGESFDRAICIANTQTTCDNCLNISRAERRDVSAAARDLAMLVRELGGRGENVTMLHVGEVYKGAMTKKIVARGDNKHKLHGAGKGQNKIDIQRILKELMFKEVIVDYATYVGDFPVVYVKVGRNYDALFKTNMKLTIDVLKSNTPKPLPTTSTATTDTDSDSYKIAALKVKCHEDLLEVCRKFAMERNVTLSSVMNLSAIKTMSELLPATRAELMTIQHVTKANYDKFGEGFLAVTSKYRNEMDAMSVVAGLACEDFGELDEASWGNDDSFGGTGVRSSGGGSPRKRRSGKRKYPSGKKSSNAGKWLQKSKKARTT